MPATPETAAATSATGEGEGRRLPTRVFGLTHEPVVENGRHSRLGNLFPALDRRLHVAGYATPEIGRAADLWLKARHVHRDRVAWRERAWLNATRFGLRTRAAERALADHAGEYDVILEVQTMFGPGADPPAPYAVYTDNVLAVTRRHYPDWSRLSAAEARRVMELEAATCRGAALLLPWSEVVARALVEEYGCDPARVEVLPAASRFPAAPLEQREWGSRAALFVGFEFERKGGPELLEAWPLVRREVPDAVLRIVGPERPAGVLPDGVEWIGPVADSARLTELYSRSDVFAMPSRFDPWGLVFLEAMARGTACVSGDSGAQPELVRDGVSGFNAKVGDPASIAGAVVPLLADPELAEAVGRRGWQQVRDGATWDTIAARMAPRLERIS